MWSFVGLNVDLDCGFWYCTSSPVCVFSVSITGFGFVLAGVGVMIGSSTFGRFPASMVAAFSDSCPASTWVARSGAVSASFTACLTAVEPTPRVAATLVAVLRDCASSLLVGTDSSQLVPVLKFARFRAPASSCRAFACARYASMILGATIALCAVDSCLRCRFALTAHAIGSRTSSTRMGQSSPISTDTTSRFRPSIRDPSGRTVTGSCQPFLVADSASPARSSSVIIGNRLAAGWTPARLYTFTAWSRVVIRKGLRCFGCAGIPCGCGTICW